MTIITDKHIVVASKIMGECVEALLKSHHSDWSRLMNELDMAHDDWQTLYLNKGEEWSISSLYNGDKIKELLEIT